MKWGVPPIIKIYEALGCIADDRIKLSDAKTKVYSSSREKFYEVEYDQESNSIMCNDNASYYVGYLGYPAIAYLMKIGVLLFSKEYSEALKNIHWKDVNQRYKNDFNKTQKYVDDLLVERGVDLNEFKKFTEKVLKQIEMKQFNLLGKKKLPPKGY